MGDSESDDSENEGGSGNVSRVVMRPPGHSGKAKKGHLCFDASFETGNLGKVDLVSDFEYDLYIRSDTCNPRHRIWFNFVVDNVRSDQRVIFNIVNISVDRNLYCEGMTPIVRSTSKKKWNQMPRNRVSYHRSPLHHNRYILSLSFCFDKEEEGYQFAFSYPFSYSRSQAYIDCIERKKLPYFKREVITHSIQKRKVDFITIGTPSLTRTNGKVRVVLILSRIHPSESPVSYICQGIIDLLTSDDTKIRRLRNYVVLKIIPMLNPDGVVLGNDKSNLLGFDLNKFWDKISQYAHPTLYAAKKVIFELSENKDVELDFILDLHAHCTLKGVFVYGNTYDVYRQERHLLFPKLLSQHIEGYESSYTMFNKDQQKRGSARRNLIFLTKLFPIDRCIGRNIVRTLYDYYKCIGILPTVNNLKNIPTTSKSKQKKRKKKRCIISKLKRKYKCVKITRDDKNATNMLREVTSVHLKSKIAFKKSHIDFSNIKFPSKNKILPKRNNYVLKTQNTNNVKYIKNEKDTIKLNEECKSRSNNSCLKLATCILNLPSDVHNKSTKK